jgi:hypothetical protein
MALKNTAKTKVNIPKTATEEERTVTEGQYDREEAEKAIKSALITLAIVSAIHYYWGTTQPLIFQSILPIKNVGWDSNVAKIYFWKQKADGKLKRPWKVDNPLQ